MKITLEQYEGLEPGTEITFGNKKLHFSTPNRLTLARAQTILTKEPCTIEWLNDLGPRDLLLDVGANVGTYSTWAAKMTGAQVVSCEPEAGNFYLLNKNIRHNNLDKLIKAYCIGLSDRNDFCSLHMSKIQLGGSLNSVDEMLDCNRRQQSFNYEQGCVIYCLDTLIEEGRFPIPTHIKIDVDGIEHKVIGGALEVLSDPNVKSLLVEVDSRIDQHKKMIGTLSDLGFWFSEKQVAKAKRKEGPFIGVAEYIFRR